MRRTKGESKRVRWLRVAASITWRIVGKVVQKGAPAQKREAHVVGVVGVDALRQRRKQMVHLLQQTVVIVSNLRPGHVFHQRQLRATHEET